MHEDNNTYSREFNPISKIVHRLPKQQEYDTGQEYINRLTDTL